MREIKESRVMILNANAAMVLRHLQDCPKHVARLCDDRRRRRSGESAEKLAGWTGWCSVRSLRCSTGSPPRLKMQESGLDEAQMQEPFNGSNASALVK
jgi:hypothetical protein